VKVRTFCEELQDLILSGFIKYTHALPLLRVTAIHNSCVPPPRYGRRVRAHNHLNGFIAAASHFLSHQKAAAPRSHPPSP
jgi:hypothetical protein